MRHVLSVAESIQRREDLDGCCLSIRGTLLSGFQVSYLVNDPAESEANDQGILTALDTTTGKMVYEERLNLGGGAIYPSISLAGNRLYVSSESGSTVVLQPGREYKELARNKLEPFRSSLVFEGKRVYIRTEKRLYCIGD